MNISFRSIRAATVLFAAMLHNHYALSADSSQAYNLAKVEGMAQFRGSERARTLLSQNGFTVADPFFKQIFEPYIASDLPLFISTDSAWHTYHVLLEEGVKQLEQVQSRRLARFSRQLLEAANERAAKGDADFAELARHASLGLAFQDAKHLESLSAAEKSLAETLRSGIGEVRTPNGFPLSAVNFRAASFYTQSPELADYFGARQWYASVVFRLQNERETRLALKLAWLIESRSELSNLWQQLSAPYDSLLASAEDGDVRSYGETVRKLFIGNISAITAKNIADAQEELAARLPVPLINDQLLAPADAAHFYSAIEGFRLLPPRRLPCALTFQNTTDPVIPKRMFPSGLDFLVSSPTLRSQAAVRALELQSGKAVVATVEKFDCEPFPDSLHGEAMRLLALLQKPVPVQAPDAFRTEAWADQQLWTQLGAWAEQRHTWALHTKLNVMFMGMTRTPRGMVAPYPEFFAGLASLARKTADALNQAGLTEPFDARATANEMLSQISLRKQMRSPEFRPTMKNEADMMKQMEQIVQFERFFAGYFEKIASGLKSSQEFRKAEDKAVDELESLARRVAAAGTANDADAETLKQFAKSAQTNVPDLLKDFAPVCERLAELARKPLAGQTLTEEDSKWIQGYGTTLARFHFYEGNSYLEPRDDFPIATRIFSNPNLNSVLYAGLGRPQALYVIVADGGKAQLYRGAVMTYREFTRDAGAPLDDEAWRKMVFDGLAPAPPPFTKSFFAQADAKELIAMLRRDPGLKQVEGEYESNPNVEAAAELLRSRATAADLPELIALLRRPASADEKVATAIVETICHLAQPKDVANLISLLREVQSRDRGWLQNVLPAFAEGIAPLPWEPHQAELIRLLNGTDSEMPHAVRHILASKPEKLDVRLLASDFERQPTQARSLRLWLLAKAPPNTEAREMILHGLQDKDDGVRWQAIAGIYSSKWSDERSLAALTQRLEDTNQFVAAGAVFVLGKFGVTNAAPVILQRLEACAKLPPLSDEGWKRQTDVLSQNEMVNWGWDRETDELPHFFFRPRAGNRQRMDLMRIVRPGGMPRGLPEAFSFENAAAIALGDFKYQPAAEFLLSELDGDNSEAAARALKNLDPGKLESTLVATALDQQADGTKRGLALNAIGDLAITNRVRDLLPLLNETNVIVPIPRKPELAWRMCDHAAVTMARLLDWGTEPRLLANLEQREELIKKLRDWAASKP